MEEDEEKQTIKYLKMIEEIRKNIVPVRPGRKNQRNKNPKKQKYPMNKKKASKPKKYPKTSFSCAKKNEE